MVSRNWDPHYLLRQRSDRDAAARSGSHGTVGACTTGHRRMRVLAKRAFMADHRLGFHTWIKSAFRASMGWARIYSHWWPGIRMQTVQEALPYERHLSGRVLCGASLDESLIHAEGLSCLQRGVWATPSVPLTSSRCRVIRQYGGCVSACSKVAWGVFGRLPGLYSMAMGVDSI